jgi:hypothetical protein
MFMRLLVALLFGPELRWDDVEPVFTLTTPHFEVGTSISSLRLA